MEKSRKPKIRFKGYNDDWEQRKLGEIADFYTGNGLSWNDISENGNQECILYGNLYTDYGMIAENVVYRTNTVINTPVYSEFGDVLIPASDTTPTGLARATSIEKSGVLLGGDINIVRPKKGINGSYLSLAINRNKGELIKLIKGTTVRHIHNSEIKGVIVSLPNNLCEQEIITECFRNLDHLITLHQRKLDKLINVKKSMLEKMFPKQGSTVPEIRFNGFTHDWEQRKLGEIADIVGGGTPSTTNLNYWDGDIDWYAPAEITSQIYINSSQRRITNLGYESSSAKILPPGTVLFTSRAGIGKTAILTRKGCTNQGFQSIVPHCNELDSYFIFSRSDELKQYGELVGAGSTFVEVSGKQMEAMNLMMPLTMKEQKKIGTYFEKIDHLITLHQRKLEKLKNIKKSMLEKMFI